MDVADDQPCILRYLPHCADREKAIAAARAWRAFLRGDGKLQDYRRLRDEALDTLPEGRVPLAPAGFALDRMLGEHGPTYWTGGVKSGKGFILDFMKGVEGAVDGAAEEGGGPRAAVQGADGGEA